MPLTIIFTRSQFVAFFDRMLSDIDADATNGGPIEVNPGSPWPPPDPRRDSTGRIIEGAGYREMRHPNPRVAEQKARLEAISAHDGLQRFKTLARPILADAQRQIAAAGHMAELGESPSHLHLLVQRFACDPKDHDDPAARIDFDFDLGVDFSHDTWDERTKKYQLTVEQRHPARLFVRRSGQSWPTKPGEAESWCRPDEVYAFDADNWLTDTWLRGLVHDTAVRGLHRLRGIWSWSKSHPIPDTLGGAIAFTRGTLREDEVGNAFSGGGGDDFLGASWSEYLAGYVAPTVEMARKMLLARGYYVAVKNLYRGRSVQFSCGRADECGTIGFACRGDTVVTWTKYGSGRPTEMAFDLGSLVPQFAFEGILAAIGQSLGKPAGKLLGPQTDEFIKAEPVVRQEYRTAESVFASPR